MKILTIALLIGLLAVTTKAKPTFDVIADIIHDIVHDPNEPSNHRPPPQYGYNGGYTQNAYNRPGYNQGGYGYNQRPNHHAGGYYSNSYQDGYYPPNVSGNYGPNSVYDNQGYYKGPPYAANQANGYNYNNGYIHPPQNGYKNRGY